MSARLCTWVVCGPHIETHEGVIKAFRPTAAIARKTREQ